jgi:hypothetical protein
MKTTVIKYTGVTGKARELKLVENMVGLVKWHKNLEASSASLFQDESGRFLQLPNNAWDVLGIPYEIEVK